MSEIIFQALNCKINQVIGLVPIVDADGHHLACLEAKNKLQLLPTIDDYNNAEQQLVEVMKHMQSTRTPPSAVVDPIKHVDGNTYFVVRILLPVGNMELVLIEEENRQVIPKRFENRKTATGIASDIIEVLAGGVVDWTKFCNIDMR